MTEIPTKEERGRMRETAEDPMTDEEIGQMSDDVRTLLAALEQTEAERDRIAHIACNLVDAKKQLEALKKDAMDIGERERCLRAALEQREKELADVKRHWSEDTRDIVEVEAQRDALAEALRTIQEWDCLNPPTMHLCTDFPWLKRLVDAALEGLQNPLKPLVGVEDEPGVLDESEAPRG